MTQLGKLSAALILAAVAAPALAAPETYAVDGTHTFPRFSYSHFGYSTQLSRFNKTTGTVVLDKAARTGAVDIVGTVTGGSAALVCTLPVGYRPAAKSAPQLASVLVTVRADGSVELPTVPASADFYGQFLLAPPALAP